MDKFNVPSPSFLGWQHRTPAASLASTPSAAATGPAVDPTPSTSREAMGRMADLAAVAGQSGGAPSRKAPKKRAFDDMDLPDVELRLRHEAAAQPRPPSQTGVKKRRLEGVVERLWGTRAEGKGPAATPFQQASAGPTASSAGQAAGATSSGSSRPPGQRGPMPAVPAADPRHANNREATLKYRNKKGAAAEASKAALGQAETENAALRARLQAMEAVKNQMRGEIDRLAKLPFKKR